MKKFLNPLVPTVFMLALGACAPGSDSVKVRISLPELTSATLPGFNALTYPPSSVSDFQCYILNVYGPGISSESGTNGPQPVSGCPYRGLMTEMVATNSTTLSLTVPAGPARTIQVVGFAASGLSTCPGGSYGTYESTHSFSGAANTTPSYTITQLGAVTTDLYKDKSVTIKNTYSNSSGSTYPFSCPYSGTSPTTSNPQSPPGVASQIGFQTNPVHGSTYTVPFNTQPVLQARDSAGAVVTSFNGTTATATSYTDGACTTPVGTLTPNTATFINGIATFSGMQYSACCSTIYIKFTAPGLNSICSIGVVTS